jgi:hypothetical protein
MHGGDHGTWNFAVVAGRAYTGDYSVVAVLRPLTPGKAYLRKSGSVSGGVFFVERQCCNPHAARFFVKIPV